jgi:hypothetical protein
MCKTQSIGLRRTRLRCPWRLLLGCSRGSAAARPPSGEYSR